MTKRWLGVVGTAVVALVIAGCSGTASEGETTSSDPVAGGTLTIATVAEPAGLDPALVLDNDSYRVNAQIFETLVTLAPGTTSDVVPALAASYEANEDATVWTFKLQEGVNFQDGTPFDAEAVKYNFDRWQNFPEELQGRAELIGAVLGGFGEDSLVASTEAVDPTTFVLTLKEPRPDLPIGLTLPTFSIASPTALQEYGADDTSEALSDFANEHPVGTGPFVFSSWVRGDRVELERNEDYWGDKALLDGVVFKAITDSSARLNAVQAGDVDVADLINPLDLDGVKADSSMKVVDRGSCNSGFVAFKSDVAPFDDPKIRQAVSHAINKEALIDRFYKTTGTPAWLLMPESIPYYDTSLTDPGYDPELAAELVAESSNPNPVVDFWYPTDVTRPWLPDSQGIFQAIAADLEAVGITVNPKSSTWTTYLQDSKTEAYGMFLLGWSCDYGSADNFYGGAFGTGEPNPRYNYDSPVFREALATAQTTADPETAQEAWSTVQQAVYDDLPVVPFVHGSSALAMATNVNDYVANPVFVEKLAGVWLSQ